MNGPKPKQKTWLAEKFLLSYLLFIYTITSSDKSKGFIKVAKISSFWQWWNRRKKDKLLETFVYVTLYCKLEDGIQVV